MVALTNPAGSCCNPIGERIVFSGVTLTLPSLETMADWLISSHLSAGNKVTVLPLVRLKSFGKDFFSAHRVPEYRLLASIQLLLDQSEGSRLDERVSAIKIEESLVNYMIFKNEAVPKASANKEVDNLVCSLAAKRFQETYRNTLSRGQKNMLSKFMGLGLAGDKTRMSKFLNEQRQLLLASLTKHSSSKIINDDPIMKERFSEALLMLENHDGGSDEERIQDMMLFKKLIEELESDE